MLSLQNIFDTIDMIDKQHLDIRTITMGISLLDCADEDMRRCCDKIYDKICPPRREAGADRRARSRASSASPSSTSASPSRPWPSWARPANARTSCPLALALDRAAKTCGVNFIGGYSALVQKGFTTGDRRLHAPPFPRRWRRRSWCAPASTWAPPRAGINMDAVAQMGRIIKETADLTRRQDGLGCAKLVVFCNAVEDNPFMAGAFHGVGEADTRHQRGRVRPRRGAPRPAAVQGTALRRGGRDHQKDRLPDHPHGSAGGVRRPAAGWTCPSASWICRWLPPRRWATAWRAFWRRWAWPSAVPTAPPRRWRCSTTP